MKRRWRVFAVGILALAGVGLWFLVRDPEPAHVPTIPLHGASPALIQAVTESVAEVNRDRRSAPAWGRLADLLSANGFNSQSAECYEIAARLDQDNPRWPYLRARQLLELGDKRASIPVLKHAADLAQDRHERSTALYMLTALSIEEGLTTEAEEALRRFEEVDPDSERSRYLRGMLAQSVGDRARAREYLLTLAQSPAVGSRVQRLLAQLSDTEQQSEEHRRLAESLPPDRWWPDPFTVGIQNLRVPGANGLAIYYELEGKSRHEEALDYLRKLATSATEPDVPFTLGQVLSRREMFDEAAAAYRAAIRLDKRHVQAHLQLALALLAQKDLTPEAAREALAAADRTIELESGFGPGFAVRGRALRRLNRDGEAIAAFREAILRSPESAEFHRLLGVALAENDRIADGLAELETAVRLAPPAEPQHRETLEAWKAKSRKP